MKRKQLLAVLLLLPGGIFAQSAQSQAVQRMKDSITLSYLRAAALKYPILRQVTVSREVMGKGKIRAELYDKDLYSGDAQVSRTRINLNLPVYRSGRQVISTTMNYLGQHLVLDNIKNYNPQVTVSNTDIYKTTLNLMASYSRSDTLLGRPVNFSASVSTWTDGNFSEMRINYLGLVNFPLKRTATTAYSLGLMITVDPSSPVPAFPIFSYWHKFAKQDLELFIDMPSRISLRKQLSGRAALSLGSELGGSLSFFNINNSFLPRHTIYTTLEIKSGATLEYRVHKNILLGLNGGVLSTMSSRHLEKNAKTSDYFISNNMHAVPYVNLSVSLLPVLLKL